MLFPVSQSLPSCKQRLQVHFFSHTTLMRPRCSALLKKAHESVFNLRYRARLYCCVFFSTLLILSASVHAKEQSIEYKIKAAFLYNFSKFTQWPDGTVFSEQNAFSLCILGKDPFGTTITPIENKTAHGQPIRLLYFSQMNSQLKDCRVVFIAETKPKKLQSILKKLSGLKILTVGESTDFAINGGIFGFIIDNGRVQFQINKTAAQNAQLTFNSRLLSLGHPVKTKQ